ncbi:transposase [Bradyrhizobium sp. 30]|nr:transposase [Bradyrhizobium sp. 30]
MRRVEVITGTGRRRRFSDDDKARIVEETLLPGTVVSEVARRHGLMPQQVFTWRRQARRPSMTRAEAPLFVPAVVDAVAAVPALCKARKAPRCKPKPDAGIIEIQVEGITTTIVRSQNQSVVPADDARSRLLRSIGRDDGQLSFVPEKNKLPRENFRGHGRVIAIALEEILND